jgi:hypothetical protein
MEDKGKGGSWDEVEAGQVEEGAESYRDKGIVAGRRLRDASKAEECRESNTGVSEYIGSTISQLQMRARGVAMPVGGRRGGEGSGKGQQRRKLAGAPVPA